ncbi:MAG: CsbD family protein [Acidimicrobiales bacterium]
MGHKNKARNSAQVATGKLRAVTGKSAGDERFEADDNGKQMLGHFNRAGEKVGDAFKE